MKKTLTNFFSVTLICFLFLSGCNTSSGKTTLPENTPAAEIPAKTNLPECSFMFLAWFETNENGGFSLRVGNNNDTANSLLNESVTYEIYNVAQNALSGALTGSGVGAEFSYNLPDGTVSGPWNDVHFTQIIKNSQKDVSFTARFTTSKCYKDQEIAWTDLPVQ